MHHGYSAIRARQGMQLGPSCAGESCPLGADGCPAKPLRWPAVVSGMWPWPPLPWSVGHAGGHRRAGLGKSTAAIFDFRKEGVELVSVRKLQGLRRLAFTHHRTDGIAVTRSRSDALVNRLTQQAQCVIERGGAPRFPPLRCPRHTVLFGDAANFSVAQRRP